MLISDRYASGVYIAHVRVLALALMAIGLSRILTQVEVLGARAGTLGAVPIPSLVPWVSGIDAMYFDETSCGVHSEAYVLIASEVEPSTDVILGQYFRTYDARDAQIRETPQVSIGRNRSLELRIWRPHWRERAECG